MTDRELTDVIHTLQNETPLCRINQDEANTVFAKLAELVPGFRKLPVADAA